MSNRVAARGLTPWYPKRSRARWREGAPAYICDVFDSRGPGERYTVFFTGEGWIGEMDPRVPFLGMDNSPTHPQGISMWGELKPHEFAAYRRHFGRHRIRWCDLPEHIRAHVIARANAS